MEVTLSGMLMEARAAHPWNAKNPIVLTLFRLMKLSEVQPLKHLCGML